MRILITGSTGFLGSNLIRFFSGNGYEVVGSSRSEQKLEFENHVGDLRNEIFIDKLVSSVKPDLIINTASLANVDLCEQDPGYARQIIVNTAENLAKISEKYGSRLIYISTDHLYDGNSSWYSEDEVVHPINQYGNLKRVAEIATLSSSPEAIIVRTNFFGWSPLWHSPTFGEWIYNNLKEQNEMNLFTDYYFTPIEVGHLASIIEKIVHTNFYGIINIAGRDRCSKYDFGIKMAEMGDFSTECIHPSTLSKSGLCSKRPGDLSLSSVKLRDELNLYPPSLKESILSFLKQSQGR